MNNSLSVQQLNTLISRIMQNEEYLQSISVYGEISQYKMSGAHAYFTLKDKEAQIQCVCFNARKTYMPVSDGESVIVKGAVDYYIKGGRLSLKVETIQPVGKGMLHIMLKQLKVKLNAEGLFSAEHKKTIPQFCKRICVVTSATGAVIRDIITTIRKKNNLINIDIYDVRVQGESAANDIINCLMTVDGLGYDCLILARGGGSFEDLMPFNEEKLARAIYALNTPIISAVGHETDFTLSDFVADARAATPTAGAELVAYDVDLLKRYISENIIRIGNKVIEKQRYFSEKTTSFVHAMSDKALRLVEKGEKKLILQLGKISEKTNSLFVAKENALSKSLASLDANSPVKLLKSGYFKVTAKGNNLNSVKNIGIGENIAVTGADGRLDCTVNKVTGFNIEENDK